MIEYEKTNMTGLSSWTLTSSLSPASQICMRKYRNDAKYIKPLAESLAKIILFHVLYILERVFCCNAKLVTLSVIGAEIWFMLALLKWKNEVNVM